MDPWSVILGPDQVRDDGSGTGVTEMAYSLLIFSRIRLSRPKGTGMKGGEKCSLKTVVHSCGAGFRSR
jgi:hypothetical protein